MSYSSVLRVFGTEITIGVVSIISSIVCLLLALIFVFYVADSTVRDLDGKSLPGPKNNLIQPNFYSVVRKARFSKQVSQVVHDVMLRQLGDGNISAANLFGKKIIFISHPDMVKVVLSGSHTKFPKGTRYSRLKFFLGDGLITSSGNKWKEQRGFINPSFHADALKSFISIFNFNVHKMLDIWKDRISDGKQKKLKVDMNVDMTSMTLWIICQSAFGYDFSKSQFNDSSGEIMSAHVQVVTDEMNLRVNDYFDMSHHFFPERTRNLKGSLDVIFKIVEDIVATRMKEHELEKATVATATATATHGSEDIPGAGREQQRPNKDLLDILLSGDDKFSASDLKDHSLSFLAAGHETTSSTLLWAFYELSRHPEALQCCLDEVDRVIAVPSAERGSGSLWGQVDYEDITKLTYINQVIKETLRLHPPAAIIARTTTDGCQLGEYRIPPDAVLGVCIYAVHRHNDFWDQPEEFIPDRFSPDNIKVTLKHNFQYIPFSAGPRNCIGQRFASMEMITILSLILRHYSFVIEADDARNIRFEETITWQPKNVKVVLTPRFP